MQLHDQTDHVAILSLMLVGVLIKRLHECGQLDEATERQLHQLVGGVRTHAEHAGYSDLKILFDNIDQAIGGADKQRSFAQQDQPSSGRVFPPSV